MVERAGPEPEAAGARPPTADGRRPWPVLAVLATASLLAVPALFLLDVLGDGPGGLGWPVTLVAMGLVLVALAWFASGRPSNAMRGVINLGTAGLGFAAGLIVVAFIAMSVDGCGLSPDSASWNDPLLHAGLEGRHGLPVTVQPAMPGFGFRDPDLDARWVGYDLVQVAWGRGVGYDFGPTALIAEPGMVYAAYLDLADLQGHRQEVVEFLQGFGATPDAAARIAQAMEANATSGEESTLGWGYPHFVEFHAAIPVDWEPRAAWDSFCCIGQQPTDDPSQGNDLGLADLRVGHWKFVFALTTKHLDGDGFTIDTDAAGRVEFRGLAMDDEDEYKTKVRRTLGALDLPQPGREGMQLNGSIC